VAFLNHFLTVGRHGVNVCRTNITIRQFQLPPPFSTRYVVPECHFGPTGSLTRTVTTGDQYEPHCSLQYSSSRSCQRPPTAPAPCPSCYHILHPMLFKAIRWDRRRLLHVSERLTKPTSARLTTSRSGLNAGEYCISFLHVTNTAAGTQSTSYEDHPSVRSGGGVRLKLPHPQDPSIKPLPKHSRRSGLFWKESGGKKQSPYQAKRTHGSRIERSDRLPCNFLGRAGTTRQVANGNIAKLCQTPPALPT
jgi:hypothetical protein